jgi:hypothetical protein
MATRSRPSVRPLAGRADKKTAWPHIPATPLPLAFSNGSRYHAADHPFRPVLWVVQFSASVRFMRHVPFTNRLQAKWAHLGSNQGPTGYEPVALPAELWARQALHGPIFHNCPGLSSVLAATGRSAGAGHAAAVSDVDAGKPLKSVTGPPGSETGYPAYFMNERMQLVNLAG